MNPLTFDSAQSAGLSCAGAVRLPLGLMGFEQITDYVLIADRNEEPFCWLQIKDQEQLGFVLVNALQMASEYRPRITESDVELLGIKKPKELQILNIVTSHEDSTLTVNLKAPIVINRSTKIGKQVVLAKASGYGVQHPLAPDCFRVL
ncbi:MAG TPA: flagellar assembly protein FliW [Verrucomicrobiae bacterium]|nr:flagellar assembly protein FliW [Verrucomicrobiae bacterium]